MKISASRLCLRLLKVPAEAKEIPQVWIASSQVGGRAAAMRRNFRGQASFSGRCNLSCWFFQPRPRLLSATRWRFPSHTGGLGDLNVKAKLS